MIDEERYNAARLAATEYRMVEGVRQKLTQQFGAWERYDMRVPDSLQTWFEVQTGELDAMKRALRRSIASAWDGSPVEEWADDTTGLGGGLLLVLSLAPHLARFPNPAKLWKYLGLHAARASDRSYNAQLKAWCLFRVAEPCVKNRKSPYRAVYDKRRDSRPDMLEPGECEHCDAAYEKRMQTGKNGWDCHNMGGPHYKPAHARNDALGITAKQILLDAWRVSHGMEPKHEGNDV